RPSELSYSPKSAQCARTNVSGHRLPNLGRIQLRTIAHISDLHFGRVNAAILPALTAAITAAKPDLVAVSGELTQRARATEFSAARQFLDTLPKPQIVVPGN